MSDPRPHDLISTNESLYLLERSRRHPYKWVGQALKRIATTIDYYETRLEVHTPEGKFLPESADGIACRDETIAQQGRLMAHRILNAERYETLRKLTPRQFAELWQRSLEGHPYRFDDLVDELKEKEKSTECE